MTEHIYSVLVVSSAEKFVKPMLEMLPEKMFDPIMTATDATQARRKLLENDFDIVIVNSPLKDEFGTRLALDICSKSNAGVLLQGGALRRHRGKGYALRCADDIETDLLVNDSAVRSDALLNERTSENYGKEKCLGRGKN